MSLPSGVGKTTLLNIVAGEIHPSTGEVRWGSNHGETSEQNRVAVVFQEDTVFPWMRIIDNVAFPQQLLGGDKRRVRREAGELLRQLGLDGYGNYWPRELSGGMRKRVEIARTFSQNPKLSC